MRQPPPLLTVGLVTLLLFGGCASDDSSDATPTTTASTTTEPSATTTTASPTTTEPTTTTTTIATTTTTTTTTEVPHLAEGSGSGDEVVEFSVATTAGVVTFTHDGESAFSVWELDSALEPTSQLVDTTGIYEGTRPLWDAKTMGGLAITADGDWTFTVADFDYARHEECPIDGDGDDVVVILDLQPSGFGTDDPIPVSIDVTFNGDAPFDIWVYGWVSPQHIIETIGPYNATVEVFEGMIIWDIAANAGTWAISCPTT